MEDIAKFFVGLFKDLRPPIRWLAAIGSMAVILTGFFVYEQVTQNIYLAKLEKKVNLLKELQSIAGAGVQNNPELYPIYLELVDQLSAFKPSIPGPSIAADAARFDPIRAGKAFSGALPWIILLFFVTSYQLQTDGKFSLLSLSLAVFFILVAGIFAWIGTLIPTIYSPWINFTVFPLLQFGTLLWLVRKQARSPGRV